MAQLRQDYEKIRGMNTEVIAVGPESREDFIQYWTEHDMPFTGVPDPEHEIAEPYGQQVKFLKAGRLPAMFIIDKNGLIRAKHFGGSMSDIPTDTDLLAILEKLNGEG